VIRYATGGQVAGARRGAQLTNDTTYYLVCRMNWDGSAFTSANLWVNPGFTDDVDTPAGGASLSGFSSLPITHLFFREAVLEANDILQADEIKMGTAWTDVVPPTGPPIPQVSVETKADGTGVVVPAQSITAGNSITAYAIARDGGGNYLSNTVASWSAINVINGVSGGDIVPVDGGKSAVFTAHLAGSANLRATPPTTATTYFDSGKLTVLKGPATQMLVETTPDGSGAVVPAQNVAPFSPLYVYSIVRDVAGNFLSNGPALWSLSTKTSGVANGDLVAAGDNLSAIFTGNLSGTATIRAAATGLASVDSGLLTVSRAVTWVGGGLNNWDFLANNWTADFGATTTKFLDSDDVTFDFSGSQTPAVNITTTVSPNSITVNGGDYTLGGSGAISGVGSVTNVGGGILTLLTTNNYAGFTVVSFGMLQLGNGVANGSFGLGDVIVGTGNINPVFNRTDPLALPYSVSNAISGPVDFSMDFTNGATRLAGAANNNHAKAIVRKGATLILDKTGTGVDIGANTAAGGTNLIVETGGKLILGSQSSGGDHITAAGRYIHVDGTFDANGVNEAFGVLIGSGLIDNTASSNAVLTINQAGTALGNAGEIFTFPGFIRNTGSGTLGITKDGTNTLILTSANTYSGDTRIINGGFLELGNVNAIQNSTFDQRTGDTGNLSFGNLTSATLGGLKAGRVLGLTNVSGAAVALTIGGNGQTNTYSGVLSDGGRLTKTGTGIQTLSGLNTYSGNTTVAQGTLRVNGALAGGNVSVSSGAALGGSGVIGGPTTIAAGGTVAPGNSIGTLTINATATLQGSAVMEISSPTNSDRLVATSLVLGGTLTVTNIGNTTLKAGDTFTLFAGSLSGSITAGTLPLLWPGLSWNTSSLSSAGTILVTGTAVPPVISSVSAAGGNLILSGSGGLPGATYYVVSTNNVSAPLANWPRIATNTFALDGQFTNSVPISLATPQAYFGIQVP